MVAFNNTNHQFAYVWDYADPGEPGTPSPKNDFAVEHNRYFTPGASSLPFAVGGKPGCVSGSKAKIATLADWQACCGCEKGSTISDQLEVSAIMAMAHEYLGL
jgi:hypothetical protein